MDKLPLFVLPMVLMPGEETELRVFEPRYKQMLDDCLLDNKNFGLVMSDSFEQINGWDKPRIFGCEAEILEHDTKGSNHFLKIIGRRKFEITHLFKPALPPFSDEMFDQSTIQMGIYPDMETLYDMIPEDSESTKLYISGEVEYLPRFEQIDQSTQDQLNQIIQVVMKKIGLMLGIDEDTLDDWIAISPISSIISNDGESVNLLTGMLVNDLETRQTILASINVEEAVEEIVNHFSDFINIQSS
ncbi:MAG: LON peptidase substrate-binding domain-containing protein [Candidatus Poseidoniaceae archaeon]